MPAKKRAVTVVKVPIILQGQGAATQSIRPVTKVWDIDATLEDLLRYVSRTSKDTTNEIQVIFENEIPDPGLDVIPGGRKP
jgi:hypothetical protein